MSIYTSFFKNKVIVVFGATGSWGNELVSQLVADYSPKELRIFSRGEHKQVEMRQQYKSHDYMRYIIGDVRDARSVWSAMRGADIVFNLAAVKHVPVCEENSWEAIQTNVHGAHNIVEAAFDHGTKVVVQVSTDKAVDPINLYGFTKGCAEKLFTNAQQSLANAAETTKFVCVRGGNVLNTSGSVIPLFRYLIRTKNVVTLTSPEMSRYLMRLKEAIGLVLKATVESHGGEIFVMKMPGAQIADLAQVLIKRLGDSKTQLKTIGVRPGEKLYEVLVSSNEAPRTVEDGEYYVILPAFQHDGYKKHQYKGHKAFAMTEYNSKNATQLTAKDIEALLDADGLLIKEKTDPFESVFSPLKPQR